MRKARIWRAFLIKERKFSKNKNAWLGREDSNLDMANWKSDALACPRGAAEVVFVEKHKSFGTFEFREPYRIRRVQSSGEKWGIRRKMSRLCRLEVRSSNAKSLLLLALIANKFAAENAWLRSGWRRERNWGRTFST
jgi:hypothetical protein